jgi:ubiquinone biosynthesis protein
LKPIEGYNSFVINLIKTAVKTYSHLPRYREIFNVFFKYGFGDILRLIHLQRKLEIEDDSLPEKKKDIASCMPAERLRMALEELGPTFVKFGQILSSRRDLVNEALFNELRKLQNEVPPFPGEEARKIVEDELEQPISKIFKEFEPEPFAAASLAQVHRGVLKNGEVVAVKIQRPGIAEVIEVDLEILMDLASFLAKHVPQAAVLNPVGVVKELSKSIWAEQDFVNEARNMDRFAKQFRGNKNIRVPRVHHDLTTHRVLIMEFIQGYDVDKPDELRAHDIDPVKLSERMSKLIFKQMFAFGFFHADPHAGNMTILSGGVTVLYDYGMMGTLSPTFREDIATMILGLIEKDNRMVSRSLLGMSEQGFADNIRKLEDDVEAFSQQYLDRPLKELKLGFVLNRLLDLLMENKLRMKSDFYLGIKALTQVEAIAVEINPDLNFVRFGEPYATTVIEEKYDVKSFLRNAGRTLAEAIDILKDLPLDARDLYQKIKTGRYIIPLEHRIDSEGFEPLRNTLNHIANRITNAIILASILLSSSILILAGMKIAGIVGLVIASIMALRTVLSIWQRGGF